MSWLLLSLVISMHGLNVKWNECLQSLYVIRDLVGNNNNRAGNCIFYLTRKSNEPEDGS